jgi:dephospho-CoA kinase
MKQFKTIYKEYITEGVYDPGIFKAFFLAGGPGSGKTFVTQSAFAGTGLKVVNSDLAFERGLKQANLSLKMPDEEEYFRNLIRQKAKMKSKESLKTIEKDGNKPEKLSKIAYNYNLNKDSSYKTRSIEKKFKAVVEKFKEIKYENEEKICEACCQKA